MLLEIQTCEEWARFFASLKEHKFLELPVLQNRHDSILASLSTLETFFSNLAAMGASTESTLMNSFPVTIASSAGGFASGSFTGSFAGLAMGSTVKATGSAGYTLASSSAAYANSFLEASAGVNAGSIGASGTAELRVFKNKTLDPLVNLEAQASAAALSGKAEVKTGSTALGATAMAQGEVGSVYAKAKADISKEGIDLEASVGAAAARGECSVAFSILGVTVTLTAQGSIGSAEAGASFKHKNREWEMGAKLGFIAGLGFKVKVNY